MGAQVTIIYDGAHIVKNYTVDSTFTVTYNNKTLASIPVSSSSTKTLNCAGKVMRSNIVIGNKTIQCNGKAMKGNIVIITQKSSAAVPTLATTSYNYTGTTISPNFVYDSSFVTISGDPTAINVGSYTVNFTLADPTYSWDDGDTARTKSITWAVNPLKLAVPAQSGTLTYSGSSQTCSWNSNYNTSYMTVANNTATNAGSYTATFSLKDTLNTQWSDGTTGTKTTSWTIGKKSITIPSLSTKSYAYTGSAITPSFSYDTTNVTISGTTSATTINASYTATFTLKDTANTQWSDGTTTTKSITWAITKKSLTVPTQSGTITYNGSSQSPSWNNYNTSWISIGGTASGTNAGSYTATFTLKDTTNTQWSDGTTTVKNVSWSIGKAAGYVTLNSTSTQSIAVDSSATNTVKTSHGGTLAVNSSNTNYATASISGNTITVTHAGGTGSSNRTVTITVTCAATDNYTSATATYSCSMAKTSSCVSGDTLIMMADGSELEIRNLHLGDMIMSYNMNSGKFEPQPIVLFWDESNRTSPDSLHLTFDDGTLIKVIYEHGFFNKTLNTYSYINYDNYEQFIGHEFVAYKKDGYKLVKLVKAEIIDELVEQYSLETAYNDNFITNGLISMTQEPAIGRFEYFKFSDNITWDKQDKQEKIKKYGLYTYDEWKEYVPDEELFYALNGPYFKILMEQGIITMEDIWYMLQEVSEGTKQ